MLRCFFMFCCILAGAASGAHAQEQSGRSADRTFTERSRAIDRLFIEASQKGGSYIVRYDRNGQTLIKSYGHLDCARTTPMRTDALIDSGSITKAFTYAAIYKLIESGRLKLDDALGDLLPNVPTDKHSITVSQMLDESSGFADFVEPDGTVPKGDTEVIVHDYIPLTKSQLLMSVFASPLQFKPGTKSTYSNVAYQLLAAIIEARSGQDYEAYVRRQILLPAGMTQTGYLLADFRGLSAAEQCKGTTAWGDPITRGEWKNGVSWNLMGAGGMITTIGDLRRWAEAVSGGKLFRPDIQKRFRVSSFFKPLYSRCATELSSATGSNELTFAVYLDMPSRKEGLVLVSTRSDHPPPNANTLIDILCPKPSPVAVKGSANS